MTRSSKQLDQKNKIYVMDFTWYPQDKNYDGTRTDLVEWIKTHCKKAVWQIEECPTTKRYHFQGKFSLKVSNWIKKLSNPLKMSFTISSDEGKDDYTYVDKVESRIEGPFCLETLLNQPVKTIQLVEFLTHRLWHWQAQVLDFIQVYDDRKIDIIYDKVGGIGKSIFTEYCEYIDLVEEVPAFRSMEDIFQWVYCRPKKKAYFIDMPRGMKKDKLGEFYAGIEVIKNGVAFDKRYQAKKVRFDRPRIVVFTNTLPDFSLMSMDRWVRWNIELEPSTGLTEQDRDIGLKLAVELEISSDED